MPARPPAEGDLVPLSREERVQVAGALIARFNLFKGAYRRGMLVARDDEQRELLAQLTLVLDDV
jgi:hypothetical protein